MARIDRTLVQCISHLEVGKGKGKGKGRLMIWGVTSVVGHTCMSHAAIPGTSSLPICHVPLLLPQRPLFSTREHSLRSDTVVGSPRTNLPKPIHRAPPVEDKIGLDQLAHQVSVCYMRPIFAVSLLETFPGPLRFFSQDVDIIQSQRLTSGQ